MTAMRALLYMPGVLLAAALGAPATAGQPPDQPAAAPCEACHGAHGEGITAARVPRLTGQSAEYLKKQLDDYASGARDNPVMGNFARALSEAQRRRFAAQYAAFSAPVMVSGAINLRQLARGHQLAHQGDEQRQVQACNNCHGPEGAGVAHQAPYLAGQSADYIESALKAFQQGTRKNDAGELMRSVAQRLNEADIAAVSGYFAHAATPTTARSP